MFNHHSLRKPTKTNMASRDPESHMLLVLISGLVLLSTTTNAIGVNYGTLANNLPAPTAVANFLKTKTIIDRVKLYDANPDIIRAFANTNIFVTITAANGDIPGLVNAQTAQQWVDTHIKPFYPATNINRVLVGNEILHSLDSNLINNLVPAMKSLHGALVASGFGAIQVTTPHSLGILLPTEVPSEGKFRPGWDVGVLAPMLTFLRETNSCFMVNPYPYFGYNSTTLNFALFNPNGGVVDKNSKLKYTSLFDNNMDQVYSAMNVLGYKDVGVCIGETGWPSAADNNQLGVSIADAQTYNGNLYKHVTSRIGTPLMPNRKFETFIFALFNENLKPGPVAERNFGLFEPDFTPVYDIGLMRGATPGKTQRPRRGGRATPTQAAKKWCVPKPGAPDAGLQKNLDWACSQGGVDCKAIQPGGVCLDPRTTRDHAAYVMNAYYKSHGLLDSSCDFAGTGVVTTTDPSHGGCRFM